MSGWPLHFVRPLWLLALLALPLLAWWWRQQQRQRSVWRDVVDPHLLPHLLDGGHGVVRSTGWLGLLAALLAILALAGPAWRQGDQPLWQTKTPLVIALDLSTATLANDLPPSRLLQARAKIATLLRERGGGQVALVAFADDAYTVAPMTDDARNVALFIDALSPDVMPVDGSRADRAIEWSARLLRQAGFDNGQILLLTHQASGDAREAAHIASADGYRVSVLGLGTARGAAYRNAEGGFARTALDAGALQGLARAGMGRFAAVSTGDDDLRAVGVLDPGQIEAMSTQGEKGRTWMDEGYWLLPPLMLLALFAFRRGGVLAALLLCLWLPMAPAQAQSGDGGWWRRADQQAHAHTRAGVEAYRKGDFAAASRAFGQVRGAEGQYNLGNALARQGQLEDAIKAYDRALQQAPGMADAIANRKAVADALKRKPPPSGGQQDKRQDQQRGQSKPQPGGQGAPPRDEQDGRPSSSAPGSSTPPRQPPKQDTQGQQGSRQQPSAPSTPKDAAQQRAADAAQRQRMRDAVRKQASTQGQSTQGQVRNETAQQRERRLANEAWLRRVPDDPGELLRAKFELEYERRQREGRN